MNFQYSRSYFPPAPIVDVTFISAAEQLRVGPSGALIDTGADGTIVPVGLLDEIHAPPTVEMVIRSQWGEKHNVMMYLVDVQIGDIVLPGIEVVGDEMVDEIVVGRDVLNHLSVLLDGTSETVTVSE
jgi:predicted aspartyl protease